MSERILKALMQLFAIIAKVDSANHDGGSVVKTFLKQQLSVDQVDNYYNLFEEFLNKHQKKSKDDGKKRKRTSSSSVKVLVICTQINSELTQKQKIVVLLRLLEFIYADEEIGEQEIEFVETVASTFNIPDEEFRESMDFVKASSETIPDAPNFLVIDAKKDNTYNEAKHIYSEALTSPILVLQIPSVGLYVNRYFGNSALYLNGQVIQKDRVYFLTHGSSLRNQKVKPIYFSDISSKYRSTEEHSHVTFNVDSLQFKFNEEQFGLHTLNLAETSGNLIGIMGASGAGKSTLLNLLNGTMVPTSGSVKINGIDIHHEKDQLEGIIGHISQDDLLLEDLTVFQNLYYNTKLCYDSLPDKEIVKKVVDLLKTIGLYDIRELKVGNPLNKKISGGQRKRLNIALELIREPQVLFVDEPTSGLSSRDSENIMDLLKELALKGKLIFVVIHQPSSDIFKMFDNLLILDTGGFPIYYGNPVDAVIYFKQAINHVNSNESECFECGNVNPEQIFNIIETKVVDEYGNITDKRKIKPNRWNSNYNEELAEIQETKVIGLREIEQEVPEGVYKIPSKLSQFKVFFQRDVLSKIANKQYMLINFLEAPFLAIILAFLVKFFSDETGSDENYIFWYNENLTAYLFMSTVVALFLGLTVSAEEIIRDQKILKRESFLNLSRTSYLLSKVSIMVIISAIQTFSYVMIGNYILEIHGLNFDYWLILFATSCFANMLGLNISSAFDSVVTIYILIPILLIPQLLLSGVIVKFDKLHPSLASHSKVPLSGDAMVSRWAFEALAVNQFKENEFERMFYPYDQRLSRATFMKSYWTQEIGNILNHAIKNYKDPKLRDEVEEELNLVNFELAKELKLHPEFSLKLKPFSIENFDEEHAWECKDYMTVIRDYYIDDFNKVNINKQKYNSQKQDSKEKYNEYMALMRGYQNESLSDLVKSKSELQKILVHEGELIPKMEPIYRESDYFRAHFFAPKKTIFGVKVDTFWVNFYVIILMSITLYFVLFFDIFRKIIDGAGDLFTAIISKFTS